MNIAVDARELCGRPAGVGRYLSELLLEWSQSTNARRHAWTLYAHRAPGAALALGDLRVLPGKGGTAWEQWTFARAMAAERPDVLFAPGYTAPLTAPCPVVVTVHDVSFSAHPEWFSFPEGLRRRWVTGWSARRAMRVLTDSRFSAGEIERHLGVPAARLRTIVLGVRRPVPAPAPGPREPLVLYVGSIFERRNVDRLMLVFADRVATAVPAARLEIVGWDRRPAHRRLEAQLRQFPATIRDRISIRSYVDDAALHELYRRASVFAFPSAYEGFGLTPLEALAAGVPPVVLDTPIAREVYGDAARYVPEPGFRQGLGDAMIALLSSDEARRAILRHAPAVLSRYDWTRTAADTLAALEEAAVG